MNDPYELTVLSSVRVWLEERAEAGVTRTTIYITRDDIYPTIPAKIPDGKVVKAVVEFVPEDETRPC